jgi:hypothetical protein
VSYAVYIESKPMYVSRMNGMHKNTLGATYAIYITNYFLLKLTIIDSKIKLSLCLTN